MAQQILSTNTFTAATWIVNSDATKGTHTTLAGALTSASAGDSILLQTSVTENPTLKAGVNIFAAPGAQFRPNVSITGKCTMTTAGTATISNIQLITNSDFLLAVTGSAASIVDLDDCFLNSSNNTGISFSSSSASAQIMLKGCRGDLGTTGIGIFAHSSAGNLSIEDSFFTNTGASLTASTCSAGTLTLLGSFLANPITMSGTGAITSKYSEIDTNAGNVTSLTTVTGTTNELDFTRLASGTATPFSAGGTTSINGLILHHSNAVAISGGGTTLYNGIWQDSTVGTISNTTTTGKGVLGVLGSTAPPAGYIGQLVTSAITAATTIAVNTITNVTSITPGAGIWEITGIVEFSYTVGVGVTNVQGCLATANNNFTPIDDFGSSTSCGVGNIPTTAAAASPNVLLGPCRLSTTGATVVYLNAFFSATSATTRTYQGVIRAVRVA